jgi:hypothetical protein
MKIKTILALVLGLVLSAAAQTPPLAQSLEYPWRLQVDFTYSAGALVSAPIVQFYRSDITQGSVLRAQPDSTPPSLTVDLVQSGSRTVTVGGTTYTYAQAIGIVTAILAQERAAQLAPTPTPTPTPAPSS